MDYAIRNIPIKPIAGKQLDIEKMRELTGIDWHSFVADFIVLIPGIQNAYDRHGRTALFKLDPKQRSLVKWENSKFVIDKKALSESYEQFREYTESPEQLKELAFWTEICKSLNSLIDRQILDISDSHLFEQRIGLVKVTRTSERFQFVPDYKKLANAIKNMAVATC